MKMTIGQVARQAGVGVETIRFYERHGFCLVSAEEKDRLLSTYWTISQRQRETSVVLKYAGARA